MVLTPMEKEDEPRILAARQEARRYMLRGEYEAAVNVLAPWRPKCSVRTQLGCQTLMDLAVAYEAIYGAFSGVACGGRAAAGGQEPAAPHTSHV